MELLINWEVELNKTTCCRTVLTYYGSFRHWGHPYIDYLAGLRILHQQVTVEKDVDTEYAEILGSDLARIVLTSQFKQTKKWAIIPGTTSVNHPFYKHISENTWPTASEIHNAGDCWHQLKIARCFEMPEALTLATTYSDKSHSMTRSEVLSHIKEHPNKPIPSKKVLITLLEKSATNWSEFLDEIDQHGLPDEDLLIGLKGKERDENSRAVFYSMSWRLREYFVVTEYLIKKFFVPLFSGMTMADDMTELTKIRSGSKHMPSLPRCFTPVSSTLRSAAQVLDDNNSNSLNPFVHTVTFSQLSSNQGRTQDFVKGGAKCENNY